MRNAGLAELASVVSTWRCSLMPSESKEVPRGRKDRSVALVSCLEFLVRCLSLEAQKELKGISRQTEFPFIVTHAAEKL